MEAPKVSSKNEVMVFSKHLISMPLGEAARSLREMNIHSLDLTVRSKGHVDPAKVTEELPKVFRLLADEGINIGMLTTEITSTNSPFAEEILETAGKLGIRHYKTGYYKLEAFHLLSKQRDEVRSNFEKLAKLNEKHGIQGAYHNHSGNFFGATLHEIYEVLKDINPQWLGFYLDPAHAVLENGVSGWITGVEKLQNHLCLLAVKDFKWIDSTEGWVPGRRNSIRFCPLEEGNVPWDKIFSVLKAIKFNGPISLHSEYQGKHSFKDLSTCELLDQTQKDFAYLQKYLSDLNSASQE